MKQIFLHKDGHTYIDTNECLFNPLFQSQLKEIIDNVPTNTNKYFVFTNDIVQFTLVAAQPTITLATQYMAPERILVTTIEY